MMSFRELLESGANVSVTVKLDDLRTIFKEAAGTIRLTPDEPPTEEFLSRKEVLPFLKSTLPRFGAGRKPGTSNRARSAVANVTDERRSRRSAQAGEGAMMGAKKEK